MKIKYFIFFLSLFLLLSCSNSKRDSSVIVSIKNNKIYEKTFKNNYYQWLSKKGLKDSKKLRKIFLYNFITNELLYDLGKKEGVEYLPDIIAKVKKYKKKLIIEKMQKKVHSEVYGISDKKIKEFYLKNRNMFFRDKFYRFYAIRIKSKKKMNKILRLLKENPDKIQSLSTRFSDDKFLAENNGDFGLFSEDIMDKSWKKAALKAKLGDIIGPFLDSEGYYTILELSGFAYRREIGFRRAYPLIVDKIISENEKKGEIFRSKLFKQYGISIDLKKLNWE